MTQVAPSIFEPVAEDIVEYLRHARTLPDNISTHKAFRVTPIEEGMYRTDVWVLIRKTLNDPPRILSVEIDLTILTGDGTRLAANDPSAGVRVLSQAAKLSTRSDWEPLNWNASLLSEELAFAYERAVDRLEKRFEESL